MIKNEKQYQVTKTRLKEFRDSLNALISNDENDSDPIYRKIEQDALQSQILEFENELYEYEVLKKGQVSYICIDSLSNFYQALIKARIAKGWTHADLADSLELKEQQIQRYELCNYSTASIARISQIATALGIEMRPFKVMVSQPKFSIPDGFDREKIFNAHRRIKEKRSLLTL